MNRIRVRIGGGRGYDILVGFGILRGIGRHIKRLGVGGKPFVVTSPVIGRLYLKDLSRGLRSGGYGDIGVGLVRDGERFKSFPSYRRLASGIVRHGRNDDQGVFVVNLGGGVINDLGGFLAATHRRGVDLIQVPTTLLALVDSGIGGKTGIDVDGVKNIFGAFHQPRLVYADLGLLGTLARRELRSALAEVVKYGVIGAPRFFGFVERNVDKVFSLDRRVMTEIVLVSCRMKADVVRRDERETRGIRTILNYGHTIGHAVESASNYAYRHGEAVSIGMVCANDIAVDLGLLEGSVAARIENLLIRIGLPVRIEGCDPARIMRYFRMDKKFVHGKNRLVFATRIGRTRIVEDVPVRLVESAIRRRSALARG